MSAIPCKQPKGELVPAGTNPGCFVAVCYVPGCLWTYPDNPRQYVAVKSDATEQAVRHRRSHRDAVPNVEKIVVDGRRVLRCGCGWETSHTTVTDRTASMGYHLSSVHGLVTCP